MLLSAFHCRGSELPKIHYPSSFISQILISTPNKVPPALISKWSNRIFVKQHFSLFWNICKVSLFFSFFFFLSLLFNLFITLEFRINIKLNDWLEFSKWGKACCVLSSWPFSKHTTIRLFCLLSNWNLIDHNRKCWLVIAARLENKRDNCHTNRKRECVSNLWFC